MLIYCNLILLIKIKLNIIIFNIVPYFDKRILRNTNKVSSLELQSIIVRELI